MSRHFRSQESSGSTQVIQHASDVAKIYITKTYSIGRLELLLDWIGKSPRALEIVLHLLSSVRGWWGN